MKRLQASSWVLANAAADPNPTPTANVPREFLVFAEGANAGDKGTFIFDGQSAASIMANRGKRAEVMIDLEHLSLDPDARHYDPNSYGWGVLEYRPGQGLYVTSIKWTEEGAQRLLARAQRYISPAFRVDESGRVTELANVALTALPAMRNLSPLIAANVTKGRKMPEELLTALGLAPDASLDEALGKISELMQGMAAAAEDAGAEAAAEAADTAAEAAAEAADTAAEEMAEQASAMTDEEKLAAIMAEEDEEKAMGMLREYRGGGKTDDGEDVAASLAARVARVEKSEASRVIAANASRMTPAQREYAKGLELASLNAFVAALPSGPALPGPPPRRPTGGRAAHKLDESALLVANATGVNAKDIVAHRAAYQEKMARRAGKVSK